jgi:hypothetical protein
MTSLLLGPLEAPLLTPPPTLPGGLVSVVVLGRTVPSAAATMGGATLAARCCAAAVSMRACLKAGLCWNSRSKCSSSCRAHAAIHT